MRKTKQLLALLLAGSIFLTGCGKGETSNDRSTASSVPSGSADASSVTRNMESNPGNTSSANDEETASDSPSQTSETPVPTAGVITPEQGYSDSDREISIVGLKEYKKIKTDKYTDKAGKGKRYLVLFLKVHNRTNEKVYFNVNYLSGKVDDKKIENTVLFNEPEEYPTIFSNIAADSYYGGFIVWEVPKDWKKLEVTYEGWRDSNGLTLNSALTKKDLTEPEKYSQTAYDQYEEE